MWEGGGATGFLFIAEQAVEFPQVLASIIGICLNIKCGGVSKEEKLRIEE